MRIEKTEQPTLGNEFPKFLIESEIGGARAANTRRHYVKKSDIN